MSEKDIRNFTHKELAGILVKHAGISEGHWSIHVEYGLAAANIPIGDPGGELVVKPASIVAINRIGIVRSDEATPLSVDASTIKEASKKPVGRSKKKPS